MTIQRVAVLGAGVMGAGIAAHLANAGIESLLYDLNAEMAAKGVQTATKIKPAALMNKADAALITPATYDDDADKLASCDWIVEVVVERLDIKKKVYSWVADNRREGSIVSSNTSSIPLSALSEDMSDEMKAHFAITHFFNPVRYMKLLEIVAGPTTKPEIIETLSTFGSEQLGKGIVNCKDTPGFVANRVGTFGLASVFRYMQSNDLSFVEVDAIFGTPMARPKTGVFKLADLVGLDTIAHVFRVIYDNCPDDEERSAFVLPDWFTGLVDAGALGRKAGAGFYKKVGRNILVMDPAARDYVEFDKPRFPCIGAAKKAGSPQGAIKAMVWGDAATDKAAKAAWEVTADLLLYSANRVGEIADDIVNIDNGLKWGFSWDLGSFEVWDAIGVKESVERLQQEGRSVPSWVTDMLASGRETFYAWEDGVQTYWDVQAGAAKPVPQSERHLFLSTLKQQNKRIAKNGSASLWDLGDGCLGLEFHSKMNALDMDIAKQYNAALDKLDAGEFEALVVGNQDPRAFCAGANIFMVMLAAAQQQWDQIDEMLVGLQDLVMRAKYNDKPVVTAPFGLTLGGGAEVAMHSSQTVASGELYCGLVEVGVGLIPGAGGCKELTMRYLGEVPQDIAYDPNPYVQRAFEQIGLAKVSTSAEEARLAGFLRASDKVVLDHDSLLAEAKRTALGLAASGYKPPRQRTVKLPGKQALAAVELALYSMHEGGYATDHDVTVGKKLANVLVGGDIPAGTVRTEQDLLDLEREAFLSLCGTPQTLARIEHMLKTNKPLRN